MLVNGNIHTQPVNLLLLILENPISGLPKYNSIIYSLKS